MRIIITGGTGLIGRKLTQSLIHAGHDLIILSRNPSQHTPPTGAKLIEWDAQTANGWSDLVDGAGAIINLAGAGIGDGRWTESRKAMIIESRVNAGQAIMQAIQTAKHKPALLIQASAVGYYGTHNNDIKLTEHHRPGNDFLADVVQKWEHSTASAANIGVRRVVFRIGVVFSPEGGALPKLTLPFKFMAGGPMGDGEQWVSWVHIDDAVRAVCQAVNDGSMQGVYNLTSPAPVQNSTVAQKIGEVLDKPIFLATPSIALRLALGEMATLVLDGQRVIPKRLLETGFQFRFVDVETALRNLLTD